MIALLTAVPSPPRHRFRESRDVWDLHVSGLRPLPRLRGVRW